MTSATVRRAAPSLTLPSVRRVLLACGIASSLTYVAANVLGALRWEGYSSISQSVSELSAIDAPSRPIVVALMIAYSILSIAFGLGVRGSAGSNRALRVAGGLLVVYGAVCLTGPLTPMHQRGAEASLTDTLHIVATIADILLILLIVGFGAMALGRRFRLYSIATIVMLLATAAWALLVDGPRIAAGRPTPWVGVTERTSIGLFLLWVAVFAVAIRARTAWSSRSPRRWRLR